MPESIIYSFNYGKITKEYTNICMGSGRTRYILRVANHKSDKPIARENMTLRSSGGSCVLED